MLVVELEAKQKEVETALQIAQKTLGELRIELSVVEVQTQETKDALAEWKWKLRAEKQAPIASIVSYKSFLKNVDVVRGHHNKCLCLKRALETRIDEVLRQQSQLQKIETEIADKISRGLNVGNINEYRG